MGDGQPANNEGARRQIGRPTLVSTWTLTVNHGFHREQRLEPAFFQRRPIVYYKTRYGTYLVSDLRIERQKFCSPRSRLRGSREPLEQARSRASHLGFRHRWGPEQVDQCLPHGFSGLPEPHPAGTGVRLTRSPSPSGTDPDLANGFAWRRNQDSRTWLMLWDCPAS